MSFNWRETHHLYYGLILIAVSFLWGGAWLWVPGLYLVLDDAAQHFLGWPSPAKWLYAKYLWPLHYRRRVSVDGVDVYVTVYPIQRLTRWADSLFR